MHLLDDSTPTEVIHETIEFVHRSEELDFSNVWLAEHHSPYCINGAPSVVAAAIAMKTHRLGIGYAVNILPFSHPLRLAEELVLVDQLSKGRLIAGFGSGNQKRDFDMFGLDFEKRRDMSKESLEIIKKLWEGQVVSLRGNFYNLIDAKLAIEPFQKPHPPICVSVGSAESATIMGQLGYNINVAGPVSKLEEIVQAYRESCSPGFVGHVGYLRNLYVRPNTVDNKRVRQAVNHFGQLLTSNKQIDDKTVDLFYDAFGFYQSCPDLIKELKNLEAIGVDELLCSFKWGDLSYTEALLSLETFAQSIMPEFR